MTQVYFITDQKFSLFNYKARVQPRNSVFEPSQSTQETSEILVIKNNSKEITNFASR